jgi:Ser/Thr protein kinase RdoA (MazF antagonist)
MPPSLEDAPLVNLLAAWDVGQVTRVTPAAHGTVNAMFVVETSRGRFVLKRSRHTDPVRADWEQRVIAHVAERGIPAPRPLVNSAGQFMTSTDRSLYYLFPYAPGTQVPRSELTERAAAAMGRMLGRIHAALASMPLENARRRALLPERAETLSRMRRLIDQVQAIPYPNEFDRAMVARLQGMYRWLTSSPPPRPVPTRLQVVHCDYQETNIFLDDAAGEASAVIDWDDAAVAPRGWDIARAMTIMFGLEPVRTAAFLRGYRAENCIDDEELDEGALLWGNWESHSTWVYEAIYEQGREQVRAVVSTQPFQPFEHRWRGVRDKLSVG